MTHILLATLLLGQVTMADLDELIDFLLGKTDGYAGVEYVDLGLRSKTLWATCNLGSDTPEGTGNYYAWGELTTKETFANSNYSPAYRDERPAGTGILYPLGLNDTLPVTADVAHVTLGAGWEMPTYDQIQELCDQCHWAWVSVNGVNGYKVYDRNFRRYIFLPATGLVDGQGKQQNYGLNAVYWSRETARGTADAGQVYGLFFNSGLQHWAIRTPSMGFTVRPVSRSATARFDYNGDGRVSIADVATLLRILDAENESSSDLPGSGDWWD